MDRDDDRLEREALIKKIVNYYKECGVEVKVLKDNCINSFKDVEDIIKKDNIKSYSNTKRGLVSTLKATDGLTEGEDTGSTKGTEGVKE